MNSYGFLVGPYFLGFVFAAVILAAITVWSGRSTWMRALALVLAVAISTLAFFAVDDLLSRPKPVSFAELQQILPEGHPGHLVLYGEIGKEGIFLLLRSPHYDEPRYFLLSADEKMKEQFRIGQREAKKKGTQLLLGGKPHKGKKGGQKGGKKGKGVEQYEMEEPFHPAPVSGGPEKDTVNPEGPVAIPTP